MVGWANTMPSSTPVVLGKMAGGDVPNDDFQGDNGHLFYHSLAR